MFIDRRLGGIVMKSLILLAALMQPPELPKYQPEVTIICYVFAIMEDEAAAGIFRICHVVEKGIQV